MSILFRLVLSNFFCIFLSYLAFELEKVVFAPPLPLPPPPYGEGGSKPPLGWRPSLLLLLASLNIHLGLCHLTETAGMT